MRLRRVFAMVSILSVVLTGIVAPLPTSAGDPTSDIPGVPLPGPVVSSQLGGPIYDVVYSIDVPAGYVVIAGLTGTAGTDFDLYLFDSSATTVVNNVGVVARSTGPTSTEHLSYPSRFGGRYYIDLNGATNVEGTFILTVQIVPDSTPPVVSAVLAGGRPEVNSTTVSVDITAYDDLSGVPDLSFSADGATWLDWQPMVFHTSWAFAPGDGVKMLWIRVRNGVGLVSAPVTASVVLDTAPPTVTSVEPPRGTSAASLRPVVTVRFSEPIDPVTWDQYGLVVQDASGAAVPGTFGCDPTDVACEFTPVGTLTAGAAYVLTVGTVRDLAGNLVQPTGSWTLVPLTPTSVSLRASASVITPGTRVALSATASVPSGGAVAFESAAAAAGPFDLLTTALPLDGRAALSVAPDANTYYRISYSGSTTAAPSSATVRVLVRRSIALVSPPSAIADRATWFVARIGPAAAGVTVSFQLYRWNPATGRYVYASSHGARTLADGSARTAWTLAAGRYAWRALAYPTPDHTNNASALSVVTVRAR